MIDHGVANIIDPYSKACIEYAQLKSEIMNMSESDILSADKYKERVEELSNKMHELSKCMSKEKILNFESRLSDILAVQVTDPELAAGMCIAQNCMRDEDGIIRGEYNGKEFIIENYQISFVDDVLEDSHFMEEATEILNSAYSQQDPYGDSHASDKNTSIIDELINDADSNRQNSNRRSHDDFER